MLNKILNSKEFENSEIVQINLKCILCHCHTVLDYDYNQCYILT